MRMQILQIYEYTAKTEKNNDKDKIMKFSLEAQPYNRKKHTTSTKSMVMYIYIYLSE